MKTNVEIKDHVQKYVKIRKANGDIYHSCPYIDDLISLFDLLFKNENNPEMKEKAITNLETVRKINECLRESSDVEYLNTHNAVMNDLIYYASRRSQVGVDVVNDIICIIKEIEEDNKTLKKEIEELKDKIEELEI